MESSEFIHILRKLVETQTSDNSLGELVRVMLQNELVTKDSCQTCEYRDEYG